MEVVAAIPLILLPFFLPLIAGLMAVNFGRKFWPWFLVGIMLPFVANIILLCLRDKRKITDKENNTSTKPVSNEEIFDHLLTRNDNMHKKEENEVYFSASA